MGVQSFAEGGVYAAPRVYERPMNNYSSGTTVVPAPEVSVIIQSKPGFDLSQVIDARIEKNDHAAELRHRMGMQRPR